MEKNFGCPSGRAKNGFIWFSIGDLLDPIPKSI